MRYDFKKSILKQRYDYQQENDMKCHRYMMMTMMTISMRKSLSSRTGRSGSWSRNWTSSKKRERNIMQPMRKGSASGSNSFYKLFNPLSRVIDFQKKLFRGLIFRDIDRESFSFLYCDFDSMYVGCLLDIVIDQFLQKLALQPSISRLRFLTINVLFSASRIASILIIMFRALVFDDIKQTCCWCIAVHAQVGVLKTI